MHISLKAGTVGLAIAIAMRSQVLVHATTPVVVSNQSLCLDLSIAESASLLNVARLFVAPDDEGGVVRAGTSFSAVLPPDSVSMAQPDSARCASAATNYRNARQLRFPGATSTVYAIALARLGGEGFLGSSQFGDPAWGLEYVLFDVHMNVLKIYRAKL
jgi:hypothetical protein